MYPHPPQFSAYNKNFEFKNEHKKLIYVLGIKIIFRKIFTSSYIQVQFNKPETQEQFPNSQSVV